MHKVACRVKSCLQRLGLRLDAGHRRSHQAFNWLVATFEAKYPKAVECPVKDRGGCWPSARQNVVFEFGYFIGKPSRKRVCILMKGGIEMPSDLHGIGYVPLDDNGGWRKRLVQELQAAGFDAGANRVPT